MLRGRFGGRPLYDTVGTRAALTPRVEASAAERGLLAVRDQDLWTQLLDDSHQHRGRLVSA